MDRPEHDVVLRRAEVSEAREVADVWLRSRHASVPAIPAPVHTDDEVRGWFTEVVLPTREVWVVEAPTARGPADEPSEPAASALAAVLVLDGDWLDQLHVDPGWFGRGIGSTLVDLAKRRRPGGLDLWTFAGNTGARRFYERHGFVVVDATDGDNEEGEPDVRYHWPAARGPVTVSSRYEPMAFAIETERLSLRLRDVDDAPWYLELLGEHPGGTTRSLADARVHLGDQRERALADGIGFLAIDRRTGGGGDTDTGYDPIGYCGLLVGRHSFDEPEIAYELLRRAHGHGYATEAAAAVVAATFATGRRRVWATVRPGNDPSFRVLERLGFWRDHVTTDEDGDLVHLLRER